MCEGRGGVRCGHVWVSVTSSLMPYTPPPPPPSIVIHGMAALYLQRPVMVPKLAARHQAHLRGVVGGIVLHQAPAVLQAVNLDHAGTGQAALHQPQLLGEGGRGLGRLCRGGGGGHVVCQRMQFMCMCHIHTVPYSHSTRT